MGKGGGGVTKDCLCFQDHKRDHVMQIKATPKAGMQLSGLTHDRFKPGGRGAILLVIFLITEIEHLKAATSGRESPL